MFALTVTAQIRVRVFHPDDAAEIFQLIERNRPRLRPWVGPSALPETAQAARIYAIECYLNSLDPLEAIDTPYFDEVGRYFPPSWPCLEMGLWCAGELAGAISLSVLDEGASAEFGYWLAEEHQGKGMVTRCVRALTDYAIAEMKTERFVIGCATINRRSRAVPEHLGYRLLEVIPHGEVVGDFVYDRAVFEMRSADWRTRDGE